MPWPAPGSSRRAGIAAFDPTVISYAPPGYPLLVGLAYGLLGVGDIPAILVSIVAGTLTIPVVGWLGYRTFGRGAGGRRRRSRRCRVRTSRSRGWP